MHSLCCGFFFPVWSCFFTPWWTLMYSSPLFRFEGVRLMRPWWAAALSGCFSSCYCLFINRHLRRIDGGFEAFTTSRSLPSKTTITRRSQTHPPAISFVYRRRLVLSLHMDADACVQNPDCVWEGHLGLESVAFCDYFINQTYNLFFSRLISWRWTQMALSELACGSRRGRRGPTLISLCS